MRTNKRTKISTYDSTVSHIKYSLIVVRICLQFDKRCKGVISTSDSIQKSYRSQAVIQKSSSYTEVKQKSNSHTEVEQSYRSQTVIEVRHTEVIQSNKSQAVIQSNRSQAVLKVKQTPAKAQVTPATAHNVTHPQQHT